MLTIDTARSIVKLAAWVNCNGDLQAFPVPNERGTWRRIDLSRASCLSRRKIFHRLAADNPAIRIETTRDLLVNSGNDSRIDTPSWRCPARGQQPAVHRTYHMTDN